MSLTDEQKIAIAREYFRLADAGDPKLMELFHEDATFYFPKFGIGHGRLSILRMIEGFQGVLEWIRHDHASLVFTPLEIPEPGMIQVRALINGGPGELHVGSLTVTPA